MLGFLAGALTTFGLIPQVARVWRLCSAREISWLFLLMTLAGIAGWLVYGMLLGLWPVALWNTAALLLGCGLAAAKVRYGR